VLICNAHLQFAKIKISKAKCISTKILSREFTFYFLCALLFKIYDISRSVWRLYPSSSRSDSESKSESELLYDWRYTANQFALATSPLRPTTSNFIFQLNTCSYSPYITFFLTRGWVCYLQFSGPNPARLMTTFYCHRFETLSNWRARSPYLYPPGTGGPVIPPGIGFAFHRLLRLEGYGGVIRPHLHTVCHQIKKHEAAVQASGQSLKVRLQSMTWAALHITKKITWLHISHPTFRYDIQSLYRLITNNIMASPLEARIGNPTDSRC
jgi:hypothetical protein